MTIITSRRTFLATLGAALVSSPRLCWGTNEVPPLLDHVLLGCSNLDRGIAFVEERLGVRAAFGGVHPGRGTQNALLSLGTRRYLEIIAPDPRQAGSKLAQNSQTDLERRHLREWNEPRLVGWAVHPRNLDQFATRLRTAGIVFEGPQPGSRKRPDGRVLHWRTLTLKDDHGGVLPFFIEWSADSAHPSADAPHGANLARFSIAGPDSAELARICKSLDLDVAIEQSEKPQLSASIAGPNGNVMNVTS
jgi:catechol 2,3-dioxygenase-like lactoylglutathione lyase family enzyme